MIHDFLRDFITPDNIPNKFTEGMGELIKKARLEVGLTQIELAKLTYFKQSTLSKIENGKVEVSSSELLYLAAALDKPILYFFPKRYLRGLEASDYKDDLLDELVLIAKKLDDGNIKRMIAQMRAIVDYEDKNLIEDK